MKQTKTTINRQIIRLAIPSIVSNITVPLLGLVDLAIVGHIGDARSIGAIAVGSMLFNLVYWVFGFLRMGTSGLTAQAFGCNNFSTISQLLRRTIMIGLAVAALMLFFQKMLLSLALLTISPEADVVPLVYTYYNICIWGAPAVLVGNGMMGWFIGMQNTRTPMMVAIVQNIANIIASLLFVFVFKMQLEGVALGTLLAQYIGVGMAFLLLKQTNSRYNLNFLSNNSKRTNRSNSEEKMLNSWATMLKVNRDIFVRTLCLVAVNLYFLSVGARSGAVVLAVNTLLMEFYILFSFILDGFAFAGEALGGRYWGASDNNSFSLTIRQLFLWGLIMTVVFTLLYISSGQTIISLLTSDSNVCHASTRYQMWTWFIPVAGMAAFVWDGIYIGITATRGMLLSAVVSAAVFFVFDIFFHPIWGNHALWIAFLLFLSMRGLVQTIVYFARLAPSR